MYISHPMGPRNKMITTHPHLGPIGQPESFGAVQGPLLDDVKTCTKGSTKPTIRNIQAAVGLMAMCNH